MERLASEVGDLEGAVEMLGYMCAVTPSEVSDDSKEIHEIAITLVCAALVAAQTELELARQCYATHTCLVSTPIDVLPVELMAYIFSLSISASPTISLPLPPGPWHLTRVCSRWRTIALSTPSLWSKFIISVTKNNFAPLGAAVVQILERSQPLPITFVLHSSAALPDLQRRLSLYSHPNRCRSRRNGTPEFMYDIPPIYDSVLPSRSQVTLVFSGDEQYPEATLKQLLSTLGHISITDLALESFTNQTLTLVSLLARHPQLLPNLECLRVRLAHVDSTCRAVQESDGLSTLVESLNLPCPFHDDAMGMGALFYELHLRNSKMKVHSVLIEMVYGSERPPRCARQFCSDLQCLKPEGLTIEFRT